MNRARQRGRAAEKALPFAPPGVLVEVRIEARSAAPISRTVSPCGHAMPCHAIPFHQLLVVQSQRTPLWCAATARQRFKSADSLARGRGSPQPWQGSDGPQSARARSCRHGAAHCKMPMTAQHRDRTAQQYTEAVANSLTTCRRLRDRWTRPRRTRNSAKHADTFAKPNQSQYAMNHKRAPASW